MTSFNTDRLICKTRQILNNVIKFFSLDFFQCSAEQEHDSNN